MQLTPRFLISHADELGEFFPSVARFLLTPEERMRQGLRNPPWIPDASGSCCALVVWGDSVLAGLVGTVLQRSFCVPLCWRNDAGAQHSAQLPGALHALANQVRGAVQEAGAWSLHLAPVWNDVDLSETACGWESAWAPLYAALVIATEGGVPSGNVFATGSWGVGGGIVHVEGVEHKVQAVLNLGLASAALFVPAANYDEAAAAISSQPARGLSIHSYEPGSAEPKPAMKRHLEKLDKPPRRVDGDSYDRRLAYLNRGRLAFGDANRYQAHELGDELACLIRKRLPNDLPKVARLALFLSNNWALAALILKVLDPQEVCLVVSKESESLADNVRKSWVSTGRIDAHRPLWGPSEAQELKCLDEVTKWLRKSASSESAVEVTGGMKTATAILVAAAQQTKSRILYLDNAAPLSYGNERMRWLKYLSAWAFPANQ